MEKLPGKYFSRSPFDWWYRLATTPLPPHPLFWDVELHRRARLTAVLILVVIAGVIPGAVVSPRPLTIVIVSLVTLVNLSAVILNRANHLILAGCLVTVSSSAGLIATQFNYIEAFGGVDTAMFFLPALLIQIELIVVSLLPAFTVFLAALFNSSFWIALVVWMPHTPSTDVILALPGLGYGFILGPPVILYFITAWITYMWVSSANNALLRARALEEELMAYRSLLDHP